MKVRQTGSIYYLLVTIAILICNLICNLICIQCLSLFRLDSPDWGQLAYTKLVEEQLLQVDQGGLVVVVVVVMWWWWWW